MTPKPINFKPCRFHCSECGRTYATVGGLMKHSKYHHDPENAMTFKCKVGHTYIILQFVMCELNAKVVRIRDSNSIFQSSIHLSDL